MSAISPHSSILHVVLIEPEIPQNTGTIRRMCLAIGAQLHLIKPLGFEITEKRLRRAGLDYWKFLNVKEYESFDAFIQTIPHDALKVFIETRQDRTIYDVEFKPGSYLFFGKETTGIPKAILEAFAKDVASIPMYDSRVRSLNLSNCASIAAYEAIRQIKKL